MKKLILFFIAVAAISTTIAQTQVGSVTLPNKISVGGQNLVLNGAGIRTKAMILKLYSGGLYISKRTKSASAIINADKDMAVRLVITSGFVSSEAMIEAVNEGFKASMNGNTSSLDSEIKKFIGFFSDEIKEGDMFDITYEKGIGVIGFKNGTKLGVIAGLDFKKALFAIWLGDSPVDDKLKSGMLGK